MEIQKDVEEPKSGMEFDNTDEMTAYYKEYGKRHGFGVYRRSSTKRGGVTAYVVVACNKAGKSKQTSQNLLKPRPITKTDCKAKICAMLYDDLKWRLSTVELKHNHLCSPSKSRHYRCYRELQPHAQRKLEMNDDIGLRVEKNIRSVVNEMKRCNNLTFSQKDARNHIAKRRKLMLGKGDAESIQTYFVKMQEKDCRFFYEIECDEENRIKNLFWADARSRAAYEEFGDVITFDTTYLTNKYDMPFAPFVGVNHHGQSILLGCGLITRENTASFAWLFKNWLTCMKKAPSAIITDQDTSMKNAIELVFPNARHRLCLWHIMKKIPDKLKGFKQYKSIKSGLKNVVYDSLSREAFEGSWQEMIALYKLEKCRWLKGLYTERRRWVPCFVKDHFWAGMSTTQRSESINAFFDGYLNAKTTLKQFVEQYEHALMSKVEKETDADFTSFHSRIPTITRYRMEEQFQSAYTTSKFKEFQDELRGMLYCTPMLLASHGTTSEYEVSEVIFYGDQQRSKRVSFKVCFVVEEGNGEFEVKCNCKLFEFRGILCKHSLVVLIKNDFYFNLPTKYILRRWSKNILRVHTKIRLNWDEQRETEHGRHYNMMSKSFYAVADIAFDSQEKCKFVVDRLDSLKKEVLDIYGDSGSKWIAPLVGTQDSSRVHLRNQDMKAPIAVRCKGRPRFKRRKSTTEQILAKIIAKKKVSKIGLEEE